MLSQTLVFIIHGIILKSNIRIKLATKILAPTQNEEVAWPDGSYSLPNIQDYFGYILKKLGKNTVNPSLKIYTNIKENRITFKIKTGYYLELLTSETMKLIGKAKSKITKDKNGEKVPYLEITGNLDKVDGSTMLFIIKEVKETVLDFQKGQLKYYDFVFVLL